MSDILSSVHILSPIGIVVFLLLWLVLFEGTHVVLTLLRKEPLIGWAIGPLGITIMSLHEPSVLYIWLDVILPALVSGGVVYIGLFTSLSPIALPHNLLFQIATVICGILLSSITDIISAFRDVRHPIWGEARILRTIQLLRATWSKIHFTPFGYSYLNDQFGFPPTDLLQAL